MGLHDRPTQALARSDRLQVSLLGELRVRRGGQDVPLPASRKARALLGFLVATGRPHRRERLCELLWDMPDDPKAALRWSLTKLRPVVDTPEQRRILSDRERVRFDTEAAEIDLHDIYNRLRGSADLTVAELEQMAQALSPVLLDGLDGAGDAAFLSWLEAEREDARIARVAVLRQLVNHPELPALSAQKWQRLWRDADPDAEELLAPAAQEALPPAERQPRTDRASGLRSQRIAFCEAPDGTKIAFATLGSGPPLLKAANWLTHLEFDWTSPIWGECFAEIARQRRFIRYDERGCGLSDWDVADLGFDAFVEDLEVVADKLGLERFPLLGISQGAAVCVEYAVRHPERVSGLILVGGYAAGWRHMVSDEEKARREAVRALTELGWGTDNPAYRHIFSQTFMPDAGPDELTWFDEFQRLTTSPGNAARFQDAFGEIDVRHRLGSVRAPTIVLHSKDDMRIPLDMGRALASGIPDAHFVPLDSRNHVLVDYEPAWRTCMQTVRDFLKHYDI
ncbi:alpha/beta fold hydrolase [Salipiger sp. PrR002]|uniref:alpha/beta fold hydrolase n=1 Tax=Salipiger sp. PrR002 TaxID=2706489 RepID=UPI0013BC6266|nr:alpha/beta fold hydrolase [Salipiger sp. PrR002]NDW00175.1 alpha/beta fold hydrolase [Salipiger sp. PrR002]NDW56816.1 alpha/beta fold hydrolase [Salipiger sp. PrR004]